MIKRMISLLTAVAAAASLFPSMVLPVQAEAVGIHGWTYSTGGTQGASCSLDTKYFCYGTRSAKLSSEATGTSVTLKTDITVEQGKTYNVSFWAKSIGSNAFSFAIGNSKYSLVPVMKSYDWTKFSYKYTHQEQSTTIPIVFELKNQGEAYVDSVFVEPDEKGKKINLVANSGFEDEGTAYTSTELAEYSQTDMDMVLGGFADKRAMPVLWGGDIKVDGDVSEWSGYPVVALPQKNKAVDTISGYAGADDVSVDFMSAYDEEYLYLYAEVTDNIHSQENEGSTYWRGDSIQLALSTAQEDYGIELGFYLTDGGESKVYSAELEKTEWGAVDPKVLALREKTACKAYREGTKTYYEIAIPWAIKFETKPQQFMLNLLINDNDGSGRKGYIEWNDGIGKTKSNEKFTVIFPIENNSDVFAYIDGEKSILEQSREKYYLYIYNNSDAEKSISVLIDGVATGDVSVSSKNVYLLPFEVDTGDAGDKTVTAELLYDRTGYKTARVIPVKMDLQLAFPRFRDNQLKELKELAAKCSEMGIRTDYENITLTTIESFIDYGLEDYNGGRESRALYVYECLVDLYNEAKASLTAYIDGTAEPKTAVYYQSGDLEFKNKTIYGDTIDLKTGEVKRAPVFLSGYLDATRESYDISQVGATMLQFELPMSGYVNSADTVRGWIMNRQGGVNAEYSYDENSYKGNYSLKISNSSELKSNVYTSVAQNIALKGGKQYTLSFYAKGESANGCSFRPDGWKTSKISISGTYDWRKITYDYKPEEDCVVELMFMSEDTTGGFYLDNIRLVEKGTNVNLIKHGGFEELPVIINGYSVDVDRVQRDVITALDKAEQNNVAVDILMSVHYFPEKLLPEEEWKANQIGFVKHNLYNDKVASLVKKNELREIPTYLCIVITQQR